MTEVSFETKEKLIELIKKNDCIYNPRNKRYKNHTYKTLLWDSIGAELGMEGMRAKDIWRCLRDGYIRYKKHTRAKLGSGRKYCNYTWSNNLKFLDGPLEIKRRNKIVAKLKGTPQLTVSEIPGDSHQLSPYIIDSEQDIPQWVQAGPSWEEAPSQTQVSQHQSTISSIEPIHSVDLPPWFESNATEIQQVQSYTTQPSVSEPMIIKEKPKELDATDHLFLSYEKTFRSLSFKKQTELKIVLAKLFADAEYSEIENTAVANLAVTNSGTVLKAEEVQVPVVLPAGGEDVSGIPANNLE